METIQLKKKNNTKYQLSKVHTIICGCTIEHTLLVSLAQQSYKLKERMMHCKQKSPIT